MKIANKPLDHLNTTEWDGSSNDLENKDEKDLKRLIIQLRAELKELAQVNKSQKQQLESQSTVAESEGLDREPAPQINMDIELSKVEVKDTATQTATAEGSVGRLKHEGKIATWEDKAKSSRLNDERRQKRVSAKSKQQETPLRMSKTNKSDLCYPFKKSRLPVRVKPAKSLGSISSGSLLQKHDVHLQHRMFNLDEDLKGRCPQLPQPPNELHLSETECRPQDQDQMLVAGESTKLDGSDVDISFVCMENKGKMSAKDQTTCQDESLLKLNASDIDVSLVSAGSQEGTSSKYQSTSQETESNKPEPDVLTSKGLDQDSSLPSKQDVDLATMASMISPKPSCTTLEEFDCDTVDDVKELRRRVKDLLSELAKYHMLMTRISEPARQPPPNTPLSVIQNHEELPADSHFPPTLEGNKHESQTFSEMPQQVDHGIQVEDLASRLLEEQNEAMVEKLKELLSENEVELEREQIANMHLLDKVYRLQRKLKGVAPEGPDSPISSPAPEDSCQRQKIQESHRICATYRQHLTNLIRAFEELLQASEVDYYVAEGFREQLNQSAQLFERLEQQCLYGESIEDEMAQLGGLAERLSDLEMSQKPSCLETSSPMEEAAVAKVDRESMALAPSKFHPELLMEHLQEIRMLRHQLEESIQTNERLRKQLEQQVSDTVQDQGPANVCICSSEQHNSLTSEIHFLREQNQVLNVMLAKGSRDKQKENEKLRESLSKKHLAVEQLHADCERLKKENEKLQKEARKREEENGCLTNEVYSIRNELNRLQLELSTKQRELLENDDLMHSLRLELRVYEKLDNVIRSQKDSSRDRADECRKDQNHPFDLHDLLTEIQNLRAQLEISIKANRILHEKLEEQFSSGKRAVGSLGSTVNISYLFKQESQHYSGIKDTELTLGGLDGSSHCSLSAGKSGDPSSFSRHCVWADKNGRHVLGLVEDYNSLRKLILEGRKLLSELELPLKETSLQEPEMMASLGRIPTALCAIRHNLDEASRLLKLLWRVSLPMKVVHSAAYSLQDEAMRAELHRLRRKLAEQEKKLHSTVKRLHSTNQLKENMERVIIDQLALTHDVLKKARGNLELQPAENKPSAFSLSKTRVL